MGQPKRAVNLNPQHSFKPHKSDRAVNDILPADGRPIRPRVFVVLQGEGPLASEMVVQDR